MSRNFAAILAGFALLTACAPNPELANQSNAQVEFAARAQRKATLRAWIEGEKRLQTVGYLLTRTMGPYCQEHYRYTTGARFTRASEFDQKWSEALASEYGINDQVQLLNTLPGSPAEMSGLLPGDVPASLNDEAVDTVGGEGLIQFNEHMKLLDKEAGAQLFGVIRHGQPMQFLVIPSRVCDLEFSLSLEPGRFIYTDYNRVIVSQGLLELLYDDDQLGLVLAQQVVHNIYSHLDEQHRYAMTSATGRKAIELLVHAAERSFDWQFGRHDADKEFRQGMNDGILPKVDYAALYLAAQSGFDIAQAPELWRRMAHGEGLVDFYRPPPTTPQRQRHLPEIIAKLRMEFAAAPSNGGESR